MREKGWSVNYAGRLAQKNLKKFVNLTTRVNLVPTLLTTKELLASVGAELLGINRTSVYYKGKRISEEESACKEIMIIFILIIQCGVPDRCQHNKKIWGHHIGRRKARRYMKKMDIYLIYSKMNLSKRMQQANVCLYLLRNTVIDKPNQFWSIDITYIPI